MKHKAFPCTVLYVFIWVTCYSVKLKGILCYDCLEIIVQSINQKFFKGDF